MHSHRPFPDVPCGYPWKKKKKRNQSNDYFAARDLSRGQRSLSGLAGTVCLLTRWHAAM